ncbi:DNA/RNA polymerase [Aulographum hederae CBS 113979]|uniref:DNA polymerase eta n=1 Tax=Aulographum hederae CBS 113979 TaxID=1176131 RepID=A0A6G1H6C7_9PEZI|nr:DNA/RNA polymerase [Aulographum hederae CBS 113979]
MSSSQSFLESPPHSQASGRRRRSRFTHKQLHQLAQSTPHSPLRCIAHIDLDAFYAQCEGVRLGIPPETPLAVQQWQGLIAVNYPARAFGITRFLPLSEAYEKCPELVCQHVATWKEGEDSWAYREGAAKDIATSKVCLDPYRTESRKILACIKDALPPAPIQRVEKASIDEVFLDLSAQIHAILLERYPELNGPPPYDDPTENLPMPPTTALDWATDALVDLDGAETEDDDPDWDDIATLIGSEIVRDIRAAVYAKLKYTCSGGISKNKMLAKLGSGHKKPNAQTVIRNRAVQQFLSGFKFTKIRNLGGKLGDEVVTRFATDSISDLLTVSLDHLKKALGDETGSWLHSTIRGEDYSEVNPRTQIKSMLSAKSFRPAINTFEQASRWLRIFVADIFSRCVEEGVLENKRRPRTINIHHRQGQQTRSKQVPIPGGKQLSEELLFDSAKNLMAQVVVDGRAWPCSNLSLSVGGFEEGVSGNMGIGGFLVRGTQARSLLESERERSHGEGEDDHERPPAKRRKVDTGGIKGFLVTKEESSKGENGDQEHDGLFEAREPIHDDDNDYYEDMNNFDEDTATGETNLSPAGQRSPLSTPLPKHQQSLDSYFCTRCKSDIPLTEQAEHEDFHYAKDLAKQLQEEERDSTARTSAPKAKATPQASGGGKGKRGRPVGGGGPAGSGKTGTGTEKGQRRLAFGKG